jgi:hypothetical protein
LSILQRLLDDKAFTKSQTYELQSLGVAFGDVLASEFSLRWVMITDEYGTDPTLRFKNTSINVNPVTMISKRVERDEPVDVFELLRKTREALSDAEKRFHLTHLRDGIEKRACVDQSDYLPACREPEVGPPTGFESAKLILAAKATCHGRGHG